MCKIFKIKWCLIIYLVCFWGFGSYSQNLNTLIINTPTHLGGDYTLARMEWGNQSNNEITAHAVFGDPALACTPLTNDVEGKIVFVDRSTGTICRPDAKALRAQQSGAIAVIICNHIAAPEPLQLLRPDTLANQINIPVFMATKETCDTLRIELTSVGVQATIGFKCKTPLYAPNVVWGANPGEGDFSNGLGGWTVDKGWVYNPEGIIRKGAYLGTPKVVGSSTSCNGVMEFNSDYLDNRGDPDQAWGTGDCPAICIGSLLSPTIIFAQPLSGLTIEFFQSVRNFQSEYYVVVSKDGGVSFPDTFRFNTEFPTNSYHVTERKKINIPGFEGVDSIRFKLEYAGNYYYWAIDDIVVYDEQIVDLQVNRDWYSVAPYYKMPSFQVSEIPFMADISNLGNTIATDVHLKVRIKGPSTNEHFDLNYGNIPGLSHWENRPFPLAYTSPSNIGTYTAEYHISSTEEDDGLNNKAGFQWKVTDQTFGNLDTEPEFGSSYMQFYAAGWIGVPDNKEYSIANVYYVPRGSENGAYVVTKARYGLDNTMSDVLGQAVRIDLFEWVDADHDFNSAPKERIRVGSNIQIIDESFTNLRMIETDIWASDGDGYPIEGDRVNLKDNTHYLLTATVLPHNPGLDPQMKLLGFTPKDLDNYNRSIGHMLATNFALDSLETLGILSSRVSASLFAFENPLIQIEEIDKRFFRPIFNGALYTKAFLEMDIAVRTNSQELLLPPYSLKIFPNPASRDLFVDFNLKRVSENTEISLLDSDGKLIFTNSYTNILDDRVKLDVSDLSNGLYNIRIVTSEGNASRKVVITNL